ncbi:MAG: 50S ribosomal protein L29 [Actinomycetota bacterium]|nr:50S ribosomal protein L29 [Actinomycetota bacterium]
MADTAVTSQSDTELVESLADAKRELFNLRFQLATGQLENNARIKLVKKTVARIRTEMRSRELAQQES